MSELKPCPFCGGNASHFYEPGTTKDVLGREWAYTIICDRCAASTGLGFSREQVTEAWNRRTDDGEICD